MLHISPRVTLGNPETSSKPGTWLRIRADNLENVSPTSHGPYQFLSEIITPINQLYDHYRPYPYHIYNS